MTRDRTDAIEVTYRQLRSSPRRIRFEPRSDGRWERSTAVWTGCVWRATGSELVQDVEIAKGSEPVER